MWENSRNGFVCLLYSHLKLYANWNQIALVLTEFPPSLLPWPYHYKMCSFYCKTVKRRDDFQICRGEFHINLLQFRTDAINVCECVRRQMITFQLELILNLKSSKSKEKTTWLKVMKWEGRKREREQWWSTKIVYRTYKYISKMFKCNLMKMESN